MELVSTIRLLKEEVNRIRVAVREDTLQCNEFTQLSQKPSQPSQSTLIAQFLLQRHDVEL